jgi:hypothetical protein
MSSIIVNNTKEIEGKQLKQVLHFRFSFEPLSSAEAIGIGLYEWNRLTYGIGLHMNLT